MPMTTVDAGKEHTQEQDYLWTLNFGPQHPATHTTLRIVLKLDGERVVDAVPDIGYLHSGFEKIGEHLDYNQYVTVTDRMNYVSPMANNVAWHHAVEMLMGIELTPRCKYIRVIISELARISDHLLSTGAMGLDTGAFTFFLYAFNQRESIYDIFESLCGARFTNSYTRVGGVTHDMTPVTIEKIREFIGHKPLTPNNYPSMLYAVAFSPDGKHLAMGDKAGHVVDGSRGRRHVVVEHVARVVPQRRGAVEREVEAPAIVDLPGL